MKIYQNGWVMLLLFLATAKCSTAQPPRGPSVLSPQVNAHHSIIFRYLAPAAKEIKLSAQFEKAPVLMQKDSIGIWSVKVGPVAPDIYPYSFNVDGPVKQLFHRFHHLCYSFSARIPRFEFAL